MPVALPTSEKRNQRVAQTFASFAREDHVGEVIEAEGDHHHGGDAVDDAAAVVRSDRRACAKIESARPARSR